MAGTRDFTILGCASSPGVPRINGDWGKCDPTNPRNRRTRPAFAIRQTDSAGRQTQIIIDTGPDFREQVIANGIRQIDAVLYSHAHADHLHGIDDLRGFFITSNRRVPIYADPFTMERIRQGFGYCLETPEGSSYPPIVEPRLITDLTVPVRIEGDGGVIEALPLRQIHGDIQSLGFRFGDVAYCSDVSHFPDETVEKLYGLDLLVIDTLQYRFHPSHLSLEQSLDWIERLKPKRAILTHMHTPLDYETVMAETPPHVEPAYDGLTISFDWAG